MTSLIPKIKAFLLLLAILIVWGYFVFFTEFGWLQLGAVVVCMILRFIEKPFMWCARRFNWSFLLVSQFRRVRHQFNSWCFTLWLSNDQYINTVFRGDEDHTISGRVGWLAQNGNPTALVMEKVINMLFFLVIGQRDHCRDSIEYGEL